ncbi:hypothetical protein SUGI_0866150 [Cryptomeria japonica]|nr:hypothetical protein SUGI_0866150 [Cryptomeria japonica]
MFDAVEIALNFDGLSSLLCEENADWDDEKEKEHLPREDYVESYLNRNLDVTAGREAISWMNKGVQSIAVNYLDRFLTSYQSQSGGSKFDLKAPAIYRMEVKILTTLKRRLFSIAPFNFIHYLLFTLKVIDLSVHRPSSIAAAAVMCACEERAGCVCITLVGFAGCILESYS